MRCLVVVAALDPPPFNDRDFARWCADEANQLLTRVERGLPPPNVTAGRQNSRKGVGSWLLQGLKTVRGGRSGVRNDEGGESPDAAGGRDMGAGGGKVEVRVCIYHTVRTLPALEHGVSLNVTQDGVRPTTTTLEGQRHAHLVTLSIKQEALLRPLGMNMGSRKIADRLEMWEIFGEKWMPALPQNQPLILLEGQGVIFRKQGITAVPDLDHFVLLTLPALVTDERPRIPTWLAYAASKCAPTEAPRGRSSSGTTSMTVCRPPFTPSKRSRQPGAQDDNVARDSLLFSSGSDRDEPPRRRPRLDRAATASSDVHSTTRGSPPIVSRRPSTASSARSMSPIELSDEEDPLPFPPSSQVSTSEASTRHTPSRSRIASRMPSTASSAKSMSPIELSDDDDDNVTPWPSCSQPSSSQASTSQVSTSRYGLENAFASSSFTKMVEAGPGAYYDCPWDAFSPLSSPSPSRGAPPEVTVEGKGKGRAEPS